MKSMQHLALFAAAALAPLAAQADFKLLNDASLGQVTGQAGVTIELETKVSIGEFRYTDDGSLSVYGITLGGGSVDRDGSGNVLGVTDTLNDIKVDFDVLPDGDALIKIGSVSGSAIDFAVGMQAAVLSGHTDHTVLASNIGIEGFLGGMEILVDTGTDTLNAAVDFTVEDMDLDVDFLAVGIRDLTLRGADYDTAPGPGTYYAQLFVTMGKMANGNSASGEALGIAISDFRADMNVGGILVGGTSIGSVALNDLVISDTFMSVYGH